MTAHAKAPYHWYYGKGQEGDTKTWEEARRKLERRTGISLRDCAARESVGESTSYYYPTVVAAENDRDRAHAWYIRRVQDEEMSEEESHKENTPTVSEKNEPNDHPYGTHRYPIYEDDVDTERTLWFGAVVGMYDERTQWDGRNHVSMATGDQWTHETLVRTRRGRYYLVHESQWQGSLPYATTITEERAARWLVRCDYVPSEIHHPALAAAVGEALEEQ